MPAAQKDPEGWSAADKVTVVLGRAGLTSVVHAATGGLPAEMTILLALRCQRWPDDLQIHECWMTKVFEHRLLQLRLLQKLLEPGVPDPAGSAAWLPRHAGRKTVLPSASCCSAALRLRMICAAVCRVRFLVEPPSQAGRAERTEEGGAETGRWGRSPGWRGGGGWPGDRLADRTQPAHTVVGPSAGELPAPPVTPQEQHQLLRLPGERARRRPMENGRKRHPARVDPAVGAIHQPGGGDQNLGAATRPEWPAGRACLCAAVQPSSMVSGQATEAGQRGKGQEQAAGDLPGARTVRNGVGPWQPRWSAVQFIRALSGRRSARSRRTVLPSSSPPTIQPRSGRARAAAPGSTQRKAAVMWRSALKQRSDRADTEP